ncbi:MAG: carboxypeptidase regulatory-like domain-containing protein, partial [Sedimentisphaerales bacterium]|nr:carboxypeptidase regulatory-like domain-containing protein [Sedimentisphaerales bacterium]
MKIKMMLVGVLLVMLSLLVNILGADEGRKFEFRVVDKAGGFPLGEVDLNIRVNDKEYTARTDIDGLHIVELPAETPGYFNISVRTAGYVPTKVTWRNDTSKVIIPEQYIMHLEKGTDIGGIIQNEEGKPISGVRVNLLVPSDGEIERCSIWDYEVFTDGQGKWKCNIMPAELDEVWIKLVHDDYISDPMYGPTPKPSMEKLRDLTGIMVMKKGLTVAGHVTNQAGKPLAGAEVAQGSDRHGSDYPLTKTDASGYYRFDNCKPGQMILTVSVPDGNGSNRSCQPEFNLTPRAKAGEYYAPDLKEIEVSPELGPVNFCLEKGHTIKGQIFDKDGKPLKDIPITADDWRGHRSISWYGRTDAEGRFVWNSAPADEVKYDIYPKGYMSLRNTPLVAGDTEHSLTLLPELVVSGSIKDAGTGELIKGAKLTKGLVFDINSTQTHWQRDRELVMADDGTYLLRCDYPYPGFKLQAVADGYLPQESRIFKPDEGQIEINFTLEKGSGPSGKVLNPDGSPAVGATLAICPKDENLYIENGKVGNEAAIKVKTDTEGSFSFQPQNKDYVVIALAETGYAQITNKQLTANSIVQLQPWAIVEGKIILGDQPERNGCVYISNAEYYSSDPFCCISWHGYTDADPNGYFIASQVQSGKISVGRRTYLDMEQRSSTASHSQTLELMPGQKATVNIGGKGRPVIGKVLPPADFQGEIYWDYEHGARLEEKPGVIDKLQSEVNK